VSNHPGPPGPFPRRFIFQALATRRHFFGQSAGAVGLAALADHHRLTFRFQGRDYRLTAVHGEVVDGIRA
jgi:hypothetical protein